ncbi:MAG: hypothetical protein K2I79_01705, partial [Clostridia bacterium]|nr:hypothetical protein [Clostridia bacterium]
MMTRLSKECEEVMKLASEYASYSSDKLIGTEFILAAMLSLPESEGGKQLYKFGMSKNMITELIAIDRNGPQGDATLTPRVT